MIKLNPLKFSKFITIGILLLVNFSSYANQDDKLYQIEIIVFEHLDKSGLQESWPLEPGKPSYSSAHTLKSPDHQAIEEGQQNFVAVRDEALQLDDAKERIKKQGGYRIIMHKGWKQTIPEKKLSDKLRLTGGKRYSRSDRNLSDYLGMEEEALGANIDASKVSEIDGTILLSKGRYLHLDADLLFTKPMKVLSPISDFEGSISAANSPKVSLANVANRNQWEYETNARLQPFRLKESVRLRLNEVQYIDHPIYGILIAVLPDEKA